MEVVIPEIASDVDKAEILALLVRVGQHVLASQPVLEIEAGKASFELPSPATGRIEQILVGIGDDVQTGDVVLRLETMDDVTERDLVDRDVPSSEAISTPTQVEPIPARARARMPYVRASPNARRRARELDVDLDALAAEHDGRVTLDQVEARAGGTAEPSAASPAARDEAVREVDPVSDWRSVTHLVVHRQIDVTCFEAARRRYREQHDLGPRLTLTVFVLKACAIALREHPRMNSNLIRHGRALAIKRYVHIAVANGCDRGRANPIVTNVDQRPLVDLAAELETLASTTRPPPEHTEPTFSLLQLRGFAGTRCAPVVHPPQVGTLGLCRARPRSGRSLLPISLAYDPRVNDEAAARAFVNTLAELLHDPLAMLMRT